MKKIIIAILIVSNIATGILLARYWFETTIWQNLMYGMAGYAGSQQAENDWRKGEAKVYTPGLDEDLKRTGKAKGDLEVWYWPYHGKLGKPSKFSAETFVKFYNSGIDDLSTKEPENHNKDNSPDQESASLLPDR